MSYENVKLWFAKNQNEQIITIDEIKEDNRNDTYLCPVCGSNLKPKAVKSKQVTSHFAHIDASKCNSESQIHFWFKHKFIEKGDKFTVAADKVREYVCKDILVEKYYETEYGTYKPDVTITTECGNTIYFEMAFSNKKKVKDYLDLWLELKNIVVEVDIRQLMFKDEHSSFKVLYYEGKCFNIKGNDTYYNTIGKYKEGKLKGNVDEFMKNRIRKLDWLWDDIFRYKKGEINIDDLSSLMDSIDKEDREIMEKIFKKPSCTNVMYDYMENKLNKKYIEISQFISNEYGEEYKKYLHKYLEYVRIPFVGSWYESKISIDDLANESSSVFDFSRNDYTERILKEIDSLMPKNKIIEIYNFNVKKLQDKISQNYIYHNMVEYLNPKKFYNIIIKVNKYRRNIIDKFMINFELRYKDIKISSCSFGKKVDLNEDISPYIGRFEENIKQYFNDLKPIGNIKELEILSTELKSKYEEFNLQIDNELMLEDVYKITVNEDGRYNLQTYYVFMDCVSYDVNKEKVLSKVTNCQQIKNIIINDINENLKEQTKEKCYDCGQEFVLELGEIKFFIKKGFDYPKRCKSCRSKRKQNN